MPKSTNNTLSLADDNQTLTLDIIDDPEFRDGFADGIDTYLGEVEECGRILTPSEVCCNIRHELHPKVRENSRATCALWMGTPLSICYRLSSWLDSGSYQSPRCHYHVAVCEYIFAIPHCVLIVLKSDSIGNWNLLYQTCKVRSLKRGLQGSLSQAERHLGNIST